MAAVGQGLKKGVFPHTPSGAEFDPKYNLRLLERATTPMTGVADVDGGGVVGSGEGVEEDEGVLPVDIMRLGSMQGIVKVQYSTDACVENAV